MLTKFGTQWQKRYVDFDGRELRYYSSSKVGLIYHNNNNNNFHVSNIRVSNRTLIYNVCPEAALT